MKLIRPFTVTAASLTSNVPETGTEYAVSGTYALGDVVINTTGASPTNHSYESLVAGNTGNALTDASKWLDLGATNRWAMFDNVNGTTTTVASPINVTVAVTGRADGVALLGMSGESVQVIVRDSGSTIIYDETTSLISDSGVSSWYDYFSEEIAYITDLVITDIPLYTNPTVQVIITSGSGNVSCGTMVVGQVRELGGTIYGAKAGIQDYSRKETDDFGNYTLVERSFAKRSSSKIVCDNAQVDAIFSLLAQYRATPVVWVGTDTYSHTWLFGWARDWAIEIVIADKSYLSLEIEGLT